MNDLRILEKIAKLTTSSSVHATTQLQSIAIDLKTAFKFQAVGIDWAGSSQQPPLQMRTPRKFRLSKQILQILDVHSDLIEPTWDHTPVPWLVAPMQVNDSICGRIWAVARRGTRFTPQMRVRIQHIGNLIALALENLSLDVQVKQLASQQNVLVRQIVATQDERCRRISREFHDEISQSLTALALDIEATQVAGLPSPELLAKSLGGWRTRLMATLNEINRIILDLRPSVLEDRGLVAALDWYSHQRLKPVGIQMYLDTDGVVERLPSHIEVTLYRIAQEALSNVAKHSQAHTVWVNLSRANGCLALAIRDDGCGFDVTTRGGHSRDHIGIGLRGMKERAVLVGGSFVLKSAPHKGTRINVKIPMTLGKDYDGNSSHACG